MIKVYTLQMGTPAHTFFGLLCAPLELVVRDVLPCIRNHHQTSQAQQKYEGSHQLQVLVPA